MFLKLSRGVVDISLLACAAVDSSRFFSYFPCFGCSLVSRGARQPPDSLDGEGVTHWCWSNFSFEFFHFRGLLLVEVSRSQRARSLSSSAGVKRCMKDTVSTMAFTTPFTSELEEVSPREELAHLCGSQFWRGQDTLLAWSDPTFGRGPRPKECVGRSSQPIKQRNSWQVFTSPASMDYRGHR